MNNIIIEECMEIIKLSDQKEYKYKAAKWFSSKWGIPYEAYLESIEDSFNNDIPSWYIAIEDDKIIAGMGVIKNDFHSRKDLAPNICAVYTNYKYRHKGIARKLIDYVCLDMKEKGIKRIYIFTDFVGLYERYGFEYFCDAQNEGSNTFSKLYMKNL